MRRNEITKETLRRKRKARFFAAGTAVMLALATPGSALAAESHETTTFDKYLVMKQDAQVPNASFIFAVTAGSAKTYDVAGRKFEILAGVEPEKVTMEGVGTTDDKTIAFEVGDPTSTDADANIKNFTAATQKYAKKTGTLDFSGVTFPEPGVYRYILTESGTNQGVTNDEDGTRVIDVYVMNDSTEAGQNDLYIAGYVLHSNVNDAPNVSMGNDNGTTGSYVATKSQGFTNMYVTQDLTVSKEVRGNQASRDKYFEFTIQITNAVPGTEYAVNLDDTTQTSGTSAATIAANAGKANPTKITIGDDGTAEEKFYLCDGQSIVINGISDGVGYSVTENAEDYKQSMDADSNSATGTVGTDDVDVAFINTRNGVIPTGVAMAVLPFGAVTVVGGAGIVALLMKRKRDVVE